MKALRLLLLLQFAGIITFTIAAGNQYGWDLVSVFVHDLMAMNWPGQFDFDFSCYLTLSGIWVMWRHGFTTQGIVLGALAIPLGILYFAPYLFIVSLRAKGNVLALVVGESRASRYSMT